MADAEDGPCDFDLRGSVFAIVFRHDLGGDHAVGKRRCPSAIEFGFGRVLIRNWSPIVTLDENSGLIHWIIRGQRRIVGRSGLIFSRCSRGSSLIWLRGV